MELFLLVLLFENSPVDNDNTTITVHAVDRDGNLYEKRKGKRKWSLVKNECSILQNHYIVKALKGLKYYHYDRIISWQITIIHADDEIIPVLEQATAYIIKNM